ncbi:hypothetical protein V5799_005405 [Amblyomma americanum]|uniref:Uncharacterized protein n=1 Tax=Amblyomma americanum TaxID=6943 RepID=A0AAQ4DZC4_AMBAM
MWYKVMRRIKNGVSSKTRDSEVSVVVHQLHEVVAFTTAIIDSYNDQLLMLTSALCVIFRSKHFDLTEHDK